MIARWKRRREQRRVEAEQSPWPTGVWTDIHKRVAKARALHEQKRADRRAGDRP